MEKVAIAADHGGYALKEEIKNAYADKFTFVDLGTNSCESVDYPEFGQKLAKEIVSGSVDRGILICGSGIGISIAANRYAEVRAALCTDVTMARLCREHNNANVLALGARTSGPQVIFDMIDVFLNTEFEGGRHERRVEKLSVND